MKNTVCQIAKTNGDLPGGGRVSRRGGKTSSGPDCNSTSCRPLFILWLAVAPATALGESQNPASSNPSGGRFPIRRHRLLTLSTPLFEYHPPMTIDMKSLAKESAQRRDSGNSKPRRMNYCGRFPDLRVALPVA